MNPVKFQGANTIFGPPPEMSEEQVKRIPAFRGTVDGGTCDGAEIVVTAWRPTPEELLAINNGAPIFLTCLGGLPPHFMSTSLEEAKSVS